MIYNKVAFVNPPTITGSPKMIRTFDCNTESKGNYLYQPYDFVLMSGKIPNEVEIVFIDSVSKELSKSETLDNLKKHNFDAFFIVLGENLFSEDLSFVHEVRNDFPESAIIVFGAPFVEKWAQEKVCELVDGILHNPMTFDFQKIQRKQIGLIEGEGFVNDIEVFTSPKRKAAVAVNMGLPRHELFLDSNYRWPFAESFKYSSVFISWGCPYSCSYCILQAFPNLYRPSEEVCKELLQLKELGVNEVYFADRSFGLPREEVISILKYMIEEKMNFRWSSYFHPNQYDPELLDLMAKSGCHTIIIGVEDENFDSLKAFGRHQKKEKFWNLIEHCKRLDIKICGDFIFGLPGQSKEDIEDTINFSRRIGIDFASFNVAAPLPGSSIKKEAVKKGDISQHNDRYDSLAKYNALSNGLISGKELVALRNQAVRKFYFRPSYLFKRALSLKSWQQLVIQFEEMLQMLKKVR